MWLCAAHIFWCRVGLCLPGLGVRGLWARLERVPVWRRGGGLGLGAAACADRGGGGGVAGEGEVGVLADGHVRRMEAGRRHRRGDLAFSLNYAGTCAVVYYR
jgi:hypothetical protein